MATPYILTPDALKFIAENSAMTGEQLKKHVSEKFGCDVSIQAILEHTKRHRRKTEEATRNADVEISRKIAERVDSKVINLMEIMEREIMKLSNTLQGNCEDMIIRKRLDKNGNETSFMDTREYVTVEKSLQECIKNYVSLRPQIQTVKIEGLSNPEMEDKFLASLTDDQIEVLEKISRKREKFNEKMSEISEEVDNEVF